MQSVCAHELCRGWQHFSHVRARADWARTPQQARAKVADDMTRAESFSVGDSVGPVLYLPDGRLFVGYMDQAIFGDDPPGHPARSGLAAFDRNGACVWRFAHETYRICDCYALGATGTVLWAYTYVDFPLIRVNGEEVRMWRSSVDGVHAIAVNDSHVILAGGYSSDANRLVLLQLNDTDAVPIDEFRLETDGQKVTWRGRNGAMHAIVGRKWFQIPIDDWLIAVL